MKIFKAALASSAMLCATVVSAEAPMVVVDHPSTATTLRAGTPVRLRLLNELTSKQAKTGHQFDLEVVDDVMVDGHIVIPRGSSARGEITFAKNKGSWGKSGKLDTQVTSVRVNGTDISLRGTVAQKGETGTVGVVAAIAFLPIAGFFVSGTSAELAAGTPYSGYVVNDIPLTFAKAAGASVAEAQPVPFPAASVLSVVPAAPASVPSPVTVPVAAKGVITVAATPAP